MSTATRPSSSTTTSVILENPVSQSQPTERLVLRLNRKKKVSWKDGTVDNEFMQKKSSKKCCIFHKQKPFDEDDSEEDEDNNENHHHHHDHDHNHEHSESGEASSSNDFKAV